MVAQANSLTFKLAKRSFFNRAAVTNAVDSAGVRALSKIGAFVRRTAKASIRKRKKASLPGKPPSSHVGLLRDGILFSYDAQSRSVVIGPVRFNGRSSGKVPETLEYSGLVITKEATKFRSKGGRFVTVRGRVRKVGRKVSPIAYKRKRNNIQARPYMVPAFNKEKPGFAKIFKDSLRPTK